METIRTSFSKWSGQCQVLAKIYGILANDGKKRDYTLLSKDTISLCSKEESHGKDLVLNVDTRFSLGFMLSQNTKTGSFGPVDNHNFGHPGAGGLHRLFRS